MFPSPEFALFKGGGKCIYLQQMKVQIISIGNYNDKIYYAKYIGVKDLQLFIKSMQRTYCIIPKSYMNQDCNITYIL